MSCSETNTENDTTTAEAQQKEVAEINIMFKDGNDEFQQVFNTTDKTEIEKYSTIISSNTAPQYKCGYSGNIIFTYKDGSIRDCDFNLDESCNHIVYIEDGDFISKEITPEGREVLLSLMEQGGIIVSSGVEPPMVSEYPEVNITELVNDKMLEQVKNLHPDFYKDGKPDFIQIEHQFFKPNEYSTYYIMAQVTLNRGEVKADEFGYFYPNAEGEFVAENYYIAYPEETPCKVCDLKEIISGNDLDPKGIFVDRATGKEFELNMGYNLQELLFYWYK